MQNLLIFALCTNVYTFMYRYFVWANICYCTNRKLRVCREATRYNNGVII